MSESCGCNSIAIMLAVIVIAVLVFCFNRQTENLAGSDNRIYTSGATLRRLGQKFSSTNQGVYTTVHNAEIREDSPVSVVIFPVRPEPQQN